MSIIEDRLAALDTLVLDQGGHESWEEGACVMEAVAYVAGEPWSDHPECASPVLGAFLRSLNDRLPDEERQLLKPYVRRLVGTNTGPADDETRRWMICDWLVHEYAPARLRLAGRTVEAERFEQLVTIASRADWETVRPVVREIRDAMWELRKTAFARLRADAAAAAVAAADADADAVAVADPGADADALLVAVAAAVAAAAADAVADAGPYRAALAEAVKAAAKHSGYSARWDAAYRVMRPFWEERHAELLPGLRESVFGLIDRLIDVGKQAA